MTSNQLPSVVLEQSDEEDCLTQQQTVTLTSSIDTEEDIPTNRPVYIQVMVQLGDQKHIPVNIPAEVVMPALLYSLNATEAPGNSSASSLLTTEIAQQTHARLPQSRLAASTPSPPSALKYAGLNTPTSLFSNKPTLMKRELSSDSEVEDSARQLQTSNRVAANRCRQKKKQQVEDMETKAKTLKLANKQLEDEMHNLKQEIAMYEIQLTEHQDCFSQSLPSVFYVTTT